MDYRKATWPRVSLGDVVERHRERTKDALREGLERYVKVEHFDLDSLQLRRWGEIADGGLPPTFWDIFRAGMVLYPTRSPNLRQYVVPDFDGVCGEKTLALKSRDSDVLLPEFLPFIVSSDQMYRYCNSVAVGSVNAHVRWRDLANYEFALPPLEEQRRIVSVLAAYNSLQESLIESEASARTLLRARILDLSTEFPLQNLSSAATFITSGSRGWAAHYTDEGAWFLRAGNLTRDNITLDLEDLKKVNPPDNAEGRRTRVQAGDVLVAITGIYLGKIGFITDDVPEAYVNQHIAMVRIAQDRFDPRFIAYMLTSPVAQREVWRRNEGGTKPGMTLSEVAELPIPSIPYSQQSRIADSLDQINSACSSLAVRCAAAKELYRFAVNESVGVTQS